MLRYAATSYLQQQQQQQQQRIAHSNPQTLIRNSVGEGNQRCAHHLLIKELVNTSISHFLSPPLARLFS